MKTTGSSIERISVLRPAIDHQEMMAGSWPHFTSPGFLEKFRTGRRRLKTVVLKFFFEKILSGGSPVSVKIPATHIPPRHDLRCKYR
jgi:hypothetical protein